MKKSFKKTLYLLSYIIITNSSLAGNGEQYIEKKFDNRMTKEYEKNKKLPIQEINYVYKQDEKLFVLKISEQKKICKLAVDMKDMGICQNFIYNKANLIFSGVNKNNNIIIQKSMFSDLNNTKTWDTGLKFKRNNYLIDMFNNNNSKVILVYQNNPNSAKLFEIGFTKKKTLLLEIKQKILFISLSHDDKKLAFVAQKNNEPYSKLYILDLTTKLIKKSKNSFIFIKGIQPNHGIQWNKKGDSLVVSAPNFLNGDLNTLLGHITVVNSATLKSNVFGIGYFGGWLNDNILVTEMPQYNLKIYNKTGEIIKIYPGKKLGFACGNKLLIIKKMAKLTNPEELYIYFEKNNNKFFLTLKNNHLPWKIWCHKN